jgi:TPR repeat protein
MNRGDTTQRDRERNAEDEYQLGLKYTRGMEVTQDYGMAAKLFEKAAKQGHAKAQTALGFAYHLGRGVPRNDAEAAKWFRKAAEQGDSAAQYNLGYAHFTGEGVTQNDTEAVAWFRKAAEQGFALAENNLAVMYARGRGVSKSGGARQPRTNVLDNPIRLDLFIRHAQIRPTISPQHRQKGRTIHIQGQNRGSPQQRQERRASSKEERLEMKAALYARCSTTNKRQDTENQLSALREFAAKQGWEVIGEFVDYDSGSKADRPEFQRMFQAASQRKFDVLLFWSLDRLSREGVLETLQHLNRLTSCGVGWRSSRNNTSTVRACFGMRLSRYSPQSPSKSESESAKECVPVNRGRGLLGSESEVPNQKSVSRNWRNSGPKV